MDIEQIAENFPGKNIQLNSREGGRVLISPYGAHVLSWIPTGSDERLFLSPKTEFRAGVAIRGGVPVVFPQFAGFGNLPKHGFARISPWKMMQVTEDSALFWLSESDSTRLIWPHRFLAEYSIRLENGRLEMALSVKNTDQVPFTFTAALHTYLQVKSVAETDVLGLNGLIYRDSALGESEILDTSDRVSFTSEVDRIYLDTPSEIRLVEKDRELSIGSEGFPDTVIWNPGLEKCARLNDMEPDGFRQFVCVEAAVIGKPVQLLPGNSWRGKQVLTV